jgi:hypothetical protein
MTEKTVRWWGRVPLRRHWALKVAPYPVGTLKGYRVAAKGEHVKPMPSPLGRRGPLRFKPIPGRRAMAVDLAEGRGVDETIRSQARVTHDIASGGRWWTPWHCMREEADGRGEISWEAEA